MSATISKVMNTLKKSRKSLFVDRKGTDEIHITKEVNGNPVTVILKMMPSGKYQLLPASYTFKSKVSNLDYSQKENRFCRNEVLIRTIYDELKKKELLHLVENKDTYVVVNKNNNRSNKAKVKSRLERSRKF